MSWGDEEAKLERLQSDRDSFRKWDADRRADLDDEPSRETNPLADLLLYLSDGYHTGTLLARSVAFLFVLRPDLLLAGVEGKTAQAVAAKAGIPADQLSCALRALRETAPELDAVMRSVHTSRARFLALGEMKARRRALAMRDAEALADARRQIAPERVRKSRKYAREWEQRKRLRIARQMLALADPLLKAAAEDMRAFDQEHGLHARLPVNPAESSAPAFALVDDPLERERAEVHARRAAASSLS